MAYVLPGVLGFAYSSVSKQAQINKTFDEAELRRSTFESTWGDILRSGPITSARGDQVQRGLQKMHSGLGDMGSKLVDLNDSTNDVINKLNKLTGQYDFGLDPIPIQDDYVPPDPVDPPDKWGPTPKGDTYNITYMTPGPTQELDKDDQQPNIIYHQAPPTPNTNTGGGFGDMMPMMMMMMFMMSNFSGRTDSVQKDPYPPGYY